MRPREASTWACVLDHTYIPSVSKHRGTDDHVAPGDLDEGRGVHRGWGAGALPEASVETYRKAPETEF